MDATMWSARIYGTHDEYAGADGPVREASLSGFPTDRDTVRICFGRVPDDVLHAQRAARAYTPLLLNPSEWRNAADPEEELERLAANRLPQVELSSEFVSDYGMWTTIVLERPVDLRVGERSRFRFGWPEVNHVFELERAFAAEADEALDLVVAAVATSVPVRTLAVRLSRGAVYFSAASKEPFTTGVFSVGDPTVSASRSMGDLALDQVLRRAERASTASRADRELVASATRWKNSLIGERDPLRRFLFAFFGIELLASKTLSRYADRVIRGLRPSADFPAQAKWPIRDLVWPTGSGLDQENPNRALSFRFAVLSSTLAPESAAEDMETFKKLAKARNALAHGAPVTIDELPASDAERLFDRYLALAWDDILGN